VPLGEALKLLGKAFQLDVRAAAFALFNAKLKKANQGFDQHCFAHLIDTRRLARAAIKRNDGHSSTSIRAPAGKSLLGFSRQADPVGASAPF